MANSLLDSPELSELQMDYYSIVNQQRTLFREIGVALEKVTRSDYLPGNDGVDIQFYLTDNPMKIYRIHILNQEELGEFIKYDRNRMIKRLNGVVPKRNQNYLKEGKEKRS